MIVALPGLFSYPFMPCVFGVSLQGVPGFLRHSRQTTCEGNIAGKPDFLTFSRIV